MRISSILSRFSRWRAVSPELQWFIPEFHADFLSFTQIFVAVWPNLSGARHKAERGELRLGLPVGLFRLPTGEVILNPDEEV